MSFGRAGGAAGGLSINTATANSTFGSGNQGKATMFGSTSQPQQSGALFGSQSNQQTGGLFGSQAGGQSQPSGGLFGSQPAQQQGGGGLFGSIAQQPSQAQQSGGLFTQSVQPQQGAGMFGSNMQQSQPQQGTGLFSQASGGLFGSSNTQTLPQQGGGLFGATVSQPQPQQTGGLFSNLSNQNQQQQERPSLFGGLGLSGQQNQQPQQQRLNLFGSTANNNILGGSTLGGVSLGMGAGQASNLQTQPMIPGVRIDVSNIRPTTRFTDLHEGLQKELEQIDAMIYRQIDYHNQCKAMIPRHAENLTYLPNDVEHVSRRAKSLTEALVNDAQAVGQARSTFQKDSENVKLCFSAIDVLRLLPQYHHQGTWKPPLSLNTAPYNHLVGSASLDPLAATAGEQSTARDLIEYVSQRADSMSRTLATYERNVAEIESHLRGIEARTAQQIHQLVFSKDRDGQSRTANDQIRELAAVLRDFESGIFGVAGKVGAAREGVQELILGAAKVGPDGRGRG